MIATCTECCGWERVSLTENGNVTQERLSRCWQLRLLAWLRQQWRWRVAAEVAVVVGARGGMGGGGFGGGHGGGRRVAHRQVRAGGRRQPPVLADRADRDPPDRDGGPRRGVLRAGVRRLLPSSSWPARVPRPWSRSAGSREYAADAIEASGLLGGTSPRCTAPAAGSPRTASGSTTPGTPTTAGPASRPG